MPKIEMLKMIALTAIQFSHTVMLCYIHSVIYIKISCLVSWGGMPGHLFTLMRFLVRLTVHALIFGIKIVQSKYIKDMYP